MKDQAEFPDRNAPQPYLDEDFGKELSFQVWSTKGARFYASRRLLAKQKWSTYALTALSTYVIALNLTLTYGIFRSEAPINAVVGFGGTVVSILILIVSVLEGSRHYELQAHQFHQSALEIASVYRELRLLRTGPDPAVTRESIRSLTARYETILARSTNHDQIDFLVFQTTKNYFGHSWTMKALVRIRSYLGTLFAYHLVIFSPPAVAIYYWILRNSA